MSDSCVGPLAASDIFNSFMAPILAKEGCGTLTNNPADKGGVTIWGVTESRARSAGYAGPMAAMTRDQAMAIYRIFYWLQPQFDTIATILPDLARYLLDIGINCGPQTATKFLQRSLNVLNNQARLFPDLSVDGACGLATRLALTAYREQRHAEGDGVLMGMMRALTVCYYIDLAEANPSQEAFEYGWISKRALA